LLALAGFSGFFFSNSVTLIARGGIPLEMFCWFFSLSKQHRPYGMFLFPTLLNFSSMKTILPSGNKVHLHFDDFQSLKNPPHRNAVVLLISLSTREGKTPFKPWYHHPLLGF